MKSVLTNKERRLISQIVADLETGHHLLYERPEEYKAMFKEAIYADRALLRTQRQCEISDYMKACANPDAMNEYNNKYTKADIDAAEKISNDCNNLEPLKSQVGGQHYVHMQYQPVMFIAKLHLSFSQGCIIKYVSRYRSKNKLEDLKKAVHYCKLGNELRDKSVCTKLLLIIKPKFIKREIEKYIKRNNLEGYAGACIEHTVFGNFKEVESDLRSLIAIEYSL